MSYIYIKKLIFNILLLCKIVNDVSDSTNSINFLRFYIIYHFMMEANMNRLWIVHNNYIGGLRAAAPTGCVVWIFWVVGQDMMWRLMLSSWSTAPTRVSLISSWLQQCNKPSELTIVGITFLPSKRDITTICPISIEFSNSCLRPARSAAEPIVTAKMHTKPWYIYRF